jgi:hypothetical protein
VVDTARSAAEAKVSSALSRIHYYTDLPELATVLSRQIVASEKIIIFVDASTSKVRVPLGVLDKVSKFLQVHGHSAPPARAGTPLRVRMLIPMGNRMDVAVALQKKLDTEFPTLETFIIQVTCGPQQGLKKRPQLCIFSVDQGSTKGLQVPNSVDALSCRAKRGECTRLRCLDATCPLRSIEERQALEANKDGGDVTTAELDADHLEAVVPDRAEEGEEDDAPVGGHGSTVQGLGGHGSTVQGLGPGGQGCRVVRDVWPFAFPKDFYKALIGGILGTEGVSHFVYITASSHPAAVLAARDMNMTVHIAPVGIRHHSLGHGQLILRDTLFREFYEAERASASHHKRVLEAELRFVDLMAPAEQPVHFDSVPPASEGGNWRSGLDLCPTTSHLEMAIPRLLSSELDSMGLAIVDDKGVKRLTATRGFREDEVIGVVSALLFRSSSVTAEFLNMDGNSALLDGPLFRIPNLNTDAPTVWKVVYAVPTGVGRLLTDFRGVRKFPNVVVKIAPEKGPNDGFLYCTVSTHNGCGIAAGSFIVANFGEGYGSQNSSSYPAAKRFRGALQAVFEQQAAAARAEGLGCEVPRAGGQAAEPSTAVAPKAAVPKSATQPKLAGAPPAVGKANPGPPPPTGEPAAPPPAPVVPKSQGGEPMPKAVVPKPTSPEPPTGALKLATVDEYDILIWNNKLVMRNMLAKNRKVPPHTILVEFLTGKLEEVPTGTNSVTFSFKKPSEHVFLDTNGVREWKNLTSIITGSSVDALWGHARFPKGQPPAAFQSRKGLAYVPTASQVSTFPATVGLVGASTSCNLVWIVQVVNGKITPTGLALATSKQIICPASADFVL